MGKSGKEWERMGKNGVNEKNGKHFENGVKCDKWGGTLYYTDYLCTIQKQFETLVGRPRLTVWQT